jgi:hypothetical protein
MNTLRKLTSLPNLTKQAFNDSNLGNCQYVGGIQRSPSFLELKDSSKELLTPDTLSELKRSLLELQESTIAFNEENKVIDIIVDEKVETDTQFNQKRLLDMNQPASSRCMVGDWILGETIGEGSSGKVKMAFHSKTHESVRFFLYKRNY